MSGENGNIVTPGISRKTYDGLGADDKLNILLDFSIANREDIQELKKILANKRKVDFRLSVGSGFGGGAFLLLLKWLIYR